MQHLLDLLDFSNAHTLFLSSALLSQVISNVPSAVLLFYYSSNYKIISYGVNIGGNGLTIGSFANLIVLRFLNNKSKVTFKFFEKADGMLSTYIYSNMSFRKPVRLRRGVPMVFIGTK